MTRRVPKVGDWVKLEGEKSFYEVWDVGSKRVYFMQGTLSGYSLDLDWIFLDEVEAEQINKKIDEHVDRIFPSPSDYWKVLKIKPEEVAEEIRKEIERRKPPSPGDTMIFNGKKHVAMSPYFHFDTRSLSTQVFTILPSIYGGGPYSWPAMTNGPDNKPVPLIVWVPVEDGK